MCVGDALLSDTVVGVVDQSTAEHRKAAEGCCSSLKLLKLLYVSVVQHMCWVLLSFCVLLVLMNKVGICLSLCLEGGGKCMLSIDQCASHQQGAAHSKCGQRP